MLFWASLYVAAFAPLVVANFVVAMLRGGRLEQWVASSYLAATFCQKALEGLATPMFSSFEPFVATIDIALAIWLLLLAVRNPKVWILCAAALQLVVSCAHIARLFDPQMSRLAYAILTGSGGYPSQILLLIGIVLHATCGRNAATDQ